jgi:hypothetical protein
MISNKGFATKAYIRWAEEAIWDPSFVTKSPFKLQELSEKYQVTEWDIIEMLDIRADRLLVKYETEM